MTHQRQERGIVVAREYLTSSVEMPWRVTIALDAGRLWLVRLKTAQAPFHGTHVTVNLRRTFIGRWKPIAFLVRDGVHFERVFTP